MEVLTKNHFAKVLVGREQQSGFLVSHGKDNIVGNSRFHLGNIPDRVPILVQTFDH